MMVIMIMTMRLMIHSKMQDRSFGSRGSRQSRCVQACCPEQVQMMILTMVMMMMMAMMMVRKMVMMMVMLVRCW